jgi:drug/metabolite transporter (DMT)-like permease
MPAANPLKAAIWMLGAVASFTAIAIAGREIAAELDTFELMMYRSAIGFAIVLVLLGGSRRGFAQVRTSQPGNHAVRNVIHFAGQNLWFYGVALIPLGQLVALEFTNPLWVALLAPFLLGERMTRLRVLAAVLGFAGVLIVARPGIAPFGPGHLAGLGAAFCYAMNTIYTRRIMARDSVLCVLFWMTFSQALMGFVLALPGGIPLPSAAIAVWVAVAGVCGITAHFALTSALGHAPASVVAPMDFVRLPVIAVLGAALYGEPLEAAVFLGAVLIVSGNLLNLWFEKRRQNVAAG